MAGKLSDITQQLRDRLACSSVVGRHVALTRKGREWQGLCPFHKEKTPSFYVNDDKQFYHCFGCGAHGDIVRFSMDIERLEFRDAVEKLAAIAGITIEPETPQARARQAAAIRGYPLLEAAARWFSAQLTGTGGAQTRRYLESRGIPDSMIASFRIGFAPDSRHALKSHLLSLGHSESEILEQGLIIKPENPTSGSQTYDRFRNRLIFPITDRRGRVIAFGGRILATQDGHKPQAKYLNSPETPLFHKGHTLYNLAQTSLALSQRDSHPPLLIAEGYMDVIALTEAGLPAAVAPLGTAVTEHQLALLWQLSPEPIFCLDGDAAGARAMDRAAQLALPLLKPGKSLRFARLPAGEDPDSILRTHGPRAVHDAIAHPIALSDALWESALAAHPGIGEKTATPEARAAFQLHLRTLSDHIADTTVREAYQRFFQDKLSQLNRQNFAQKKPYTPQSSRANKKDAPATTTRSPKSPLRPRTSHNPLANLDAAVTALILHQPGLLGYAEVEEAYATLSIAAPGLRTLQTAILDALPELETLTSNALLQALDLRGLAGAAQKARTDKRLAALRFLHSPLSPEEALPHWQALQKERTERTQATESSLAALTPDSDEDWETMLANQLQKRLRSD